MKIGQLKVMLQKKFKLDISQQIVSMRADKSSFPIPLDDDSCDLSYYGLQVRQNSHPLFEIRTNPSCV